MKPSHFILLIVTLLANLQAVHGEGSPLEAWTSKYQQDCQAVVEARGRQVEASRSRYTAALAEARVEAARTNKGGALAAIDAEIIDAKSEVHAPAAPADLPHALAGPRHEFLTALGAAKKEEGLRLKELNARYLQTLTTLGLNAASQKNPVLAEAVAAEKARIVSSETAFPAPPSLRKNVIVNGDFSTVDPGGTPSGWHPRGADYQADNVPWQNDASIIQEGSEKFLRFRRAASVRLSNLAPTAPILVPERAKSAVVSARLRVEGLVPALNYDRFPGVSIRALDVTGKSPGWVSAASPENTRWRVFTAKLALQPGTKTLEVSLGPWAAAGICDFDDVTVKFE